ncbi:MAG: DUF4468 domain-containing protein [Flavobacteriales bacterium]|nr:DUF4468 domain-containing protein [Flavobacteriales bacterium]MCB9190908.1 DUF4468 domain-containing protein [Flavobacteriales bacterium]
MRIIALMLIASIPFVASAQKNKDELNWPAMKIDSKTNLITYTEVPEVPGTKDELYDRAMKWGGEYFKNFAEKIRKQDKDSGEMEIFNRVQIYAYDKKGVKTTSRQGLAQYTLTIQFKDGRYKYTVTDLNFKATSYQPLEAWLDRDDPNATNHSYYLTDIDADIQATLKSLKDAMYSAGEKSGDDW